MKEENHISTYCGSIFAAGEFKLVRESCLLAFDIGEIVLLLKIPLELLEIKENIRKSKIQEVKKNYN